MTLHKRTHSNGGIPGIPPIRTSPSSTPRKRSNSHLILIFLLISSVFAYFYTKSDAEQPDTNNANTDHLPNALEGYDESYPSHLEFLLKRRSSPKYGKFITVLYVNDGDRDMVLNWLCYVRNIGFKNYIFVTDDEVLLWWFRYKAGEGAVHLIMPEGQMQSTQQRKGIIRPPRFVYNDKNFKKFMLERTEFVLTLLDRGWDVLIADVDQVWLDDPRDYLYDPVRKEGYDIVAQDDVTMLCGGFMLLRSNDNVKKLWRDVYTTFRDDGAKTNEQLILKRFLEGGTYNVKAKKLPQDLFVSGKTFFEKGMWKEIGNLGNKPVPMVIHNNFVRTKQEKLARFKALNMWRVDNVDSGTCKEPELPVYEKDAKILKRWTFKIMASTVKTAQTVVDVLPSGSDITVLLPKQEATMSGVKLITGKADALRIWNPDDDEVAVFIDADTLEKVPSMSTLQKLLEASTKSHDWEPRVYGFTTLPSSLQTKDQAYLYQRPNPTLQIIFPWFWSRFAAVSKTPDWESFTRWVETRGYTNGYLLGTKPVTWSKLKVFDGNGAQVKNVAALSLRSFAFGLDGRISFDKTERKPAPVVVEQDVDGRGEEFDKEAAERDGVPEVNE